MERQDQEQLLGQAQQNAAAGTYGAQGIPGQQPVGSQAGSGGYAPPQSQVSAQDLGQQVNLNPAAQPQFEPPAEEGGKKKKKKDKKGKKKGETSGLGLFPSAKKQAGSAQEYLDIAEIRDGTVLMKNGSLKAVLMVSSMNFALKSADEQESTIRSFQNLLNSLDDPIQILVQSRQLDIDSYLTKLKDIERQQVNELLRIQTAEYRNFIKELVGLAHIMTKRFYVVVSYQSGKAVNEGLVRGVAGFFKPAEQVVTTRKSFVEDRKKLYGRVDHVGAILSQAGLRSIVLNTQELIELLYSVYNPVSSANQDLGELSDLKLG